MREAGQKVLCLVQEQKELPDGLKDDICGRIVPDGYAGLCRYVISKQQNFREIRGVLYCY